jgi:O-antigen/teichoic acid export membrane protein
MLKPLFRDTFVYSISSLFSKGILLILLPLYANVLTPAEFGVLDLFLTLGVLINLTVALEIVQSVSRFWPEIAESKARKILASTSLWFSVMMYGIFLAFGLLFAPQLSEKILGNTDYLDEFRLAIGFAAVNGIYYLLLNQFRFELRSLSYAKTSFAYAIFSLLLAFFFCLYLELGLYGVMLAHLIAALIVSMLSLWLLRNTFGWNFDAKQLLQLLRFSIPLVPASLAVFISLYINRFAINHFGSLEDVGYFSIGSRIASLSGLLILGIQSALTPLIYQHYREPQTPDQISRLFNWFMSVALTGCLFLALFAPEFLMLFATREYMAGAVLVGVLAPSLLLSQMYIFAPGIGIAKKTHWQLWVTLLSAFVSVAGNWLLVPIWGIWGAAVATLAASLVFFLSWLTLSQRLYRINYTWRALLLACFGFIVFNFLGLEVNAMELTLSLAVFIKVLLLILLILLIVVCGLFPLTDLKFLIVQVRRHLGMADRV